MVERLSVTVGSDEIIFETGRIAKQAHGAVLVTVGETMVLSAVVVSPQPVPGQDFFPLTVDYREKFSSAGRIPGNYFRREGRPSEREVLVCRLTDRPLRPLFPKGFFYEVQVFSTVYSADNEHNPDVMSINGASAALHISKIPFDGPVGAVRVAMIGDELVVNPKMADMENSILDIVVAGTADAICMVEGGAREISEDLLMRALEFGHAHIKTICAAIEELRSRVGVEKIAFAPPLLDPLIVADVETMCADRLRAALKLIEKHPRQEAVDALKAEMEAALLERYGEELFQERAATIRNAFEAATKRIMRDLVITTNTRLDGRAPDKIRDITIEVGVLPRAHGSCLFTRGETQALVTTTLGTSRDEQRLDELGGEEFKGFMLHYNFPNWSVGEVRRISGPGRREMGHGRLSERALENMMPVEEEGSAVSAFPYTVRVVSDITESNGSSSMATVCGGTMSLMDAGVPMKTPVAGIAMGLIKEGDQARVLSDIMGTEDHLGDMDFKICGSREGVTAFQMDIKTKGITSDLMKQALEQARVGRLHILGKMHECLAAPRAEISPYAPRIYTIKIDVDKIREIIGPGGKVVRDIQAKSGAEIEIADDGTISVAAVNQESADAAIAMIRAITAVPEVGQLHKGTVTRIMPFGAFVSIMGSKEGLVHISELSDRRVAEVEDVVKSGDEVNVKVIEIDRMGRINLSKIQAERELGLAPPAAPGGEGADSDGFSGGDRNRNDRGRRDSGGRGGPGGSRPHGGSRGGGRSGGGRDRR